MKSWAKQLAATVLVLVFALAVGGFVMVLRAQQGSLAATMAAARIRAVSPPDGATNVPLTTEIRAEYVSRPNTDPAIKIEPPVGVTLALRPWRRPNRATPTTPVCDGEGKPVGWVPADPTMMWADDGRTFCGVAKTSTGSYDLEVLRINGPRVRVGTISVTPGTNQVPVLGACSILTGRAVVIGQSSGYTWSVSMISLNDGSVLYQHSYPNPLARIVASHDGQYIAEQFGSNTNGPATLIRQMPSGTTVGQFSGFVVQGFSWDGSLVDVNTFGDPSVHESH